MDKDICRTCARDILLAIWRRIDWNKISPARRMKIYDELVAKIKSSAMTNNLEKFVDKLCQKMGVLSIWERGLVDLFAAIDHAEMLRTFREDAMFIVLMLREYNQKEKEEMQCRDGKVQ